MIFKRSSASFLASMILLAIFTLSACSGNGPTQPVSQSTTEPTSTPTPEPLKTLTICLGQEPGSLYLYGNSSRAMWSVLEAIYDGPVDTVNYEPQSVLLKELPTLQNGGVTLISATVSEGDKVANVEGDVVAMRKGVKVFPAGCTSPECAVEWDGTSPISLSQMLVKFSLLEGVRWSDGQPLTADDSVFSYSVAADPATNVLKTNLERTFSYVALDETTIEWTGQPGYLTLNPAAFLWIPLPAHVLSSLSAEQMNTDETTTRKPLGWGPYQLEDWMAGDHIRLVRNENYHRADEGLPYFDEVTYRFLTGVPEQDVSPVVTGDCDIIDASAGLETQIVDIRELEINGNLKAYFGIGPEWEGLHFGIKPASYDEVYNPYLDRQDILGDVRVRQAIAYCLDRDRMDKQELYSQSGVPQSYLAPNHPYAPVGLKTYGHDVALGIRLLEEVGWMDEDGNPATPRIALGVENVLDGTELVLNYYATESKLHSRIAEIFYQSLPECGIGIKRSFLGVDEMFGTGPESVIFGRNYDLAEFAWSTGRVPPCFLYSSSEIPSDGNKWLGTKYGGVNITGFANSEYDALCADTLTAGLNEELLIRQNQAAQQILAEQLPVLPLFYHVSAMVSRPDLCGLSLDVTSRSPLKDLESLYIAENCSSK